MNRKIKAIRFVAVMMIVAMAISISVAHPFALAGGTKSMTVYNKAFKKGHYVYCVNYRKGIYKVNVKTKKAKRIAKAPVMEYTCVRWMKLYKGYIYYVDRWSDTAKLYKVKTNGKKKQCLGWVSEYAIEGNTIYFKLYDEDRDVYDNMEMNLDGTGRRQSNCTVVMTKKKSNIKNYKKYLKKAR